MSAVIEAGSELKATSSQRSAQSTSPVNHASRSVESIISTMPHVSIGLAGVAESGPAVLVAAEHAAGHLAV